MASVIQRKGKHMTELEQTAAAEKERVLRLMTKAIDEIEEDGGNFEVFTVCLMEATLFHLVEQQGENVIPKMMTRMGYHELARRGKKPS